MSERGFGLIEVGIVLAVVAIAGYLVMQYVNSTATTTEMLQNGTRAGYWRIIRVLERYGATCTLNACSEALALSPWLGRDALGRGFEISCHATDGSARRG